MANLTTLESLMALMMRSNAPDFLTNRKTWLNETQRTLCKIEPWYFTEAEESFTTALDTYTLGSRYSHITAVWRTTGSNSPLELMPVDVGSTTLLGVLATAPTHYRTATEKTITFVPPLAGSYDFRVAGHKFLTDFSAAGDENSLSIISPNILVFGALIEAALHLGRDPALWKARYEEELVILRDHWSKRGKG